MEISAERLRQLLHYSPETGVFTWAEHRRKKTPGMVAGGPSARGYIQIRVDYTRYYAHRLAWLYVHGEWPVAVDHINGNRADNRISNLRNVSQQGNMQNLHVVRNKHGMTGVNFHRKSGLYQACIKVNKVKKSLGYFATPGEAHAAYKAAKTIRDGV